MQRQHLRLTLLSLAIAGLIVACGSRTGLTIQEDCADIADLECDTVAAFGNPCCNLGDAGPDGTFADAADAEPDRAEDGPLEGPTDATVEADGPLFEGSILDVVTDCPDPPFCDPRDPGFVYKCGVRIIQCSSLEQCQQTGDASGGGEGAGAACVNPCLDTLGQDTSNGCEFYAAEMDTTDDTAGVCYAVFVVNQWKTGEPARIEVRRGDQLLPIAQFARIPQGTGTNITYAPYDAANGLPRDQIAILFLSRDPNPPPSQTGTNPNELASCPAGVTPAVVGDAALHGTGIGTAFHLKTNVPVVAYQILPYGGGRARVTGATLLLPTTAWDTNYVAANAYQPPTLFTNDRAGPTMMILGQADGTHVTINPVADILAGTGIGASPQGVPVTYRLDRGQYLQFTQSAELTGSPILADKPVAVIGAASEVDIPVSRTRADGAQQMLPPVKALGSEYAAVRYRARRNRGDESVPWRLVGAVNGTALTYEPAAPPGAPSTLNARQFAEFNSPGPFVVHSQDAAHPFYMGAYMTGGLISADPNNEQAEDGEGDPEFVNVVPPAQYLSRYTFFTDPTYPETNLVVVRVRDQGIGLFPDVSLDCAGTLTGWTNLGTSGRYQFTRVDLSTDNFQGVGGCDNGVHTIEGSFNPGIDAGFSIPRFGVTVWGWGNTITLPAMGQEADPRATRWVSYAYPAGANFTPLNNVVVTP